MRNFSICILAAALLCLGSATVRAEEAPLVEKVVLTSVDSSEFLRILQSKVGWPKGLDGIISYPKENTLVVRGNSEAFAALKSAVRVADVPVQQVESGRARVLLPLQLAKASTLLKEALELPDAGSAKIQEGKLALEGKQGWILNAIAAAVRAELVASGIDLVPPAPEKVAGAKRGGPALKPWITVTVPAGVKVAVSSEKVTYRPEEGDAFFAGPCKVTAEGFELRVRGNIRMTGVKPGQPAVIEVLSPDEPAQMILPYSTEVVLEGAKVTYRPEMMRLEASGELKIRLPQGIVAAIRDGHAVSGAMKRGEPIELTVKPQE